MNEKTWRTETKEQNTLRLCYYRLKTTKSTPLRLKINPSTLGRTKYDCGFPLSVALRKWNFRDTPEQDAGWHYERSIFSVHYSERRVARALLEKRRGKIEKIEKSDVLWCAGEIRLLCAIELWCLRSLWGRSRVGRFSMESGVCLHASMSIKNGKCRLDLVSILRLRFLKHLPKMLVKLYTSNWSKG